MIDSNFTTTANGMGEISTSHSPEDASDAGYLTWCVVLTVFQALITVAIISLNSLALVVLVYGKAFLEPKGVFIINLTCADLALGLTLPLPLITGIEERWIFGDAVCRFNCFTTIYLPQLSLAGLAMVCVDRYLAIQRPYIYLKYSTAHRALLACVITGLLLAGVCVTLIATSQTGYNQAWRNCVVEDTIRPRLVVGFFSSLLLSTVAFTSVVIARTVHRHRRQIAVQDALVNRGGVPTLFTDVNILASFHSVVIMAATMLVSALPMAILAVVPARYMPKYINVFLQWMVFANSVWNVLIYGFKNESFRKDLGQLWHRHVLGKPTPAPPSAIEHVTQIS